MKHVLSLSLGLVAMAAIAPVGAQEHREVGAHVHGAGTLAIAIEGRKVSLDLNAPANDIIGFEHKPNTDDQRKTLAAAKAKLGEPLQLFEFPAEAGCKVTSANVKFDAGEQEAKDAAAKAPEGEHQHADFDADYELDCANPAKIITLQFPYFGAFAGAQKLSVTIARDAGQTQLEVTREKPTLDLN